MGASIDASVEARYPIFAAADRTNGSLDSVRDSSGLMQGISSNCITIKKPSKQEPTTSFPPPIPCFHHLPLPQASPSPRFSSFRPWRGAAAAESLPPEAYPSIIHSPFAYGLSRAFPLCYHHGDLIKIPNLMTPKEIMDAKALAASKSHSEAERRRRKRINSHLATLRSFLPATIKTDKASLLAEVVHRVKDLKRQAAELAQISSLPSDADELQVDTNASLGEDGVLIRASLCCEDRPALFSDLSRAIKEMNLHVTKVEIVTLGGRVRNVIYMTGGDQVKQEGLSVTSVQDTLKAVIKNSTSNELTTTNFFDTKRPRLGSMALHKYTKSISFNSFDA